jgi:hypothetical protein
VIAIVDMTAGVGADVALTVVVDSSAFALAAVGRLDGLPDGRLVGLAVRRLRGELEDEIVGAGVAVGLRVGSEVGLAVGSGVGAKVGVLVGFGVMAPTSPRETNRSCILP